jgi:diaminopimelate epimerase
MRFSKWHALGNSYLLVERPDAGEVTAERAQRLCDVRTGIGADGLVEVVATEGGRADVVIWNPDGSTAEMSGNGTRIAARWLGEREDIADIEVVVRDRTVRARLLDDVSVETDVGVVEVGELETIDVHGNAVELTAVHLGNPHAVVHCEEPAREILLRLGPLVETHPRFPGRTNVQLAHPQDRHVVAALVWERGAGETSASGSSAVAVAAAAIARDWCDSPVTVRMPGGDLSVRLDDNRGLLTGPAVVICRGETSL